MKKWCTVLLFALVTPLWAQQAQTVIPKTKITKTILSHSDVGTKPYLAFPTVLQTDKDHILISIKRGTTHGGDNQADFDLLCLHPDNQAVLSHQTLGSIPSKIFQLTVPLLLPNGDIHFYTDLQHRGIDRKNYRSGMLYAVSKDGGQTVGPWKKLPLINGVEYGYPFDFIVEGKTVYMLAMSFGYRPGETWSVAVLRSTDGAKTWNFVKNISKELGGAAINESAFVRTEGGFLVVTRGYPEQETQISRFDHDFNLVATKNLTGTGELERLIGWPRVFRKDDSIYILGRIFVPGKAHFQLGLVRVHETSLSIEQIALLDNEDGNLPVKDGYYAGHYWTERDGATWFNAVTYRSLKNEDYPDIIGVSFPWNEIK